MHAAYLWAKKVQVPLLEDYGNDLQAKAHS